MALTPFKTRYFWPLVGYTTLLLSLTSKVKAVDPKSCLSNSDTPIWDPITGKCISISGATKGALTQTDPYTTIGNIINIGLGLLGLVALVLFLYAGFQWMTAGGKDDKIKSAKTLMKNAFIGIVIILLSAVLANFAVGLIRGIVTSSAQ